MELPAIVCDACQRATVDTRPIRLIRLCQVLAFLIFIMFVVWPVLDLWSPQFSKWLFEAYGINIPIAARIFVAVIAGGSSATLAVPHARFRRLATFCGVFGALCTFTIAWFALERMPEFALERMPEFHSQMIISKALFGIAFLGMAPAWLLYKLLQWRDARRETV